MNVTAQKLATAPNDANKELSQANQDAVTVTQSGSDVVVTGNMATLNAFASTNPAQGTAKWVGLDINTNTADITKLTWNGSALTADDVAEAASVGLGAGHIVFWVKAGTIKVTPATVVLGGEGYQDTTFKVSFVDE